MKKLTCKNLFVKKRYAMAWTLNWKNPVSWIIALALIVILILVNVL